MCGIAGIVAMHGARPERETVERMRDSLVHRGPDDDGLLMHDSVAFGMRRLAIIDLQTGHQPISNEDGSVSVVFNGEIYNYRELRNELQAQGHRFRTAADTEVIVHLWEQHGIDFPKRLNGMFAIALLDRTRQRVVLARDHVGVKPLYFAIDAQQLVFGSEIKAILASGRVARQLDVDALAQYLSWEYVPGAATLIRDIRRLEPAHTLELDLATGRMELRRFWDPATGSDPAFTHGVPDWEDAVDQAIRQAVRRQLVSDVPLGAFLSGGVDSSLVVAASAGVSTFSIGFEDPSYNELQWARRVASHLGVPHHFEIIKPHVLDLFGSLLHFLDDPIGDTSIFPTYLVSKLARGHAKVALSGDGGDELFGGYETHMAQRLDRYWRLAPHWLRRWFIEPIVGALSPTQAKKGFVNKARRFVEGSRLDPLLGHTRWRLFCDEAARQTLFSENARAGITSSVGKHVERLRSESRQLEERDQSLYVDFRSYLVDNCLTKVDRMSMACSLEARVPLLDRELVELAFRMPPELKFNALYGKIILRRVAARYVPRDCVYRPKEGFSVPIKTWLRAELRPLLDLYLEPGRLARAGLFNPTAVGELCAQHLSGRANHSHLLWPLLVFECWRERWSVAA